MSLNGILNTALTALQVNQSALRTTSTNIANVNTEGYQRRIVDLEPAVAGGQLFGVGIADIRRMAATFFARESIEVTSLAARAEAAAQIHDRVQTLLGKPDDGSSVAGQITSVMSALGQAALDPASVIRRSSVVSSLQQAAQEFDTLARRLQELRADTDSKIEGLIDRANALIKRVSDLNPQIQREVLSGNSATGLMDQRDMAIRELASIMDIRVQEQPDGRYFLSTPSGLSLVSDMYARLDYERPAVVTSSTVFPEITAQRINPRSGAEIGPPQSLEGNIDGGELAGLLDMRNNGLRNMTESLGALAGAFADRLNAAHADSAAVPPAASLVGRNTGLLASDSAGFSGRTSLAVVASNGALVQRIDIDFDAGANGTYSVNGGAAVAFAGGTIGDLVSGLNTALGGAGTISFSNGVMSVAATGSGNGVAFLQDASVPSSRGGRGLAHFFGLNDIMRARGPAFFDTGLQASDAHGFTAGTQVDLVLRGPSGDIALSTAYTVAGTSVGDLVTGLNAAVAGFGSFALDGNGRLTMTPSAAYAGYRIEVAGDGTARGGTGVSVSRLFGVGPQYLADQAAEMTVRSDVVARPQLLGLAQLDLRSTTVAGDIVLTQGDARGARLLQQVEGETFAFSAAGSLPSITASIGEYAAMLLSDAGQRAAIATSTQEDLSSLKSEVDERRASAEGVNLDEELAAMIKYQQAYNAGARVMRSAQDMYDVLLGLVN